MAKVVLQPGDTLMVLVKGTAVAGAETFVGINYEQLVPILTQPADKRRVGRSRRSKTEGVRFSRYVGLASYALEHGRWPSGAVIDRTEIINGILSRFRQLNSSEYVNITPNAREALAALAVALPTASGIGDVVNVIKGSQSA